MSSAGEVATKISAMNSKGIDAMLAVDKEISSPMDDLPE